MTIIIKFYTHNMVMILLLLYNIIVWSYNTSNRQIKYTKKKLSEQILIAK